MCVVPEAQRILIPVHTTALWGGLQDWCVGLVRGLTALGRQVGVATNNVLIAERCEPWASSVFNVQWDDWESAMPAVLDAGPWDVVFAQPFGGMRMGLSLQESHGVPLVYMSHGNSSDVGYIWADRVAAVLLASDSLRDMMVSFNGIDPELVHTLPNGASDAFFLGETPGVGERIGSDGVARVVLASRLSPDKLNQIPAMELLVATLLESTHISGVHMEVLGGGPMSAVFEAGLSALTHDSRVTLEMLGWADEVVVRDRMYSALFTVGGGVSGTQSVCLGTACLGAGIRCVVGASTPDNLRLLLSTNFGDHVARRVAPGAIRRDIHWLLEDANYRAFQAAALPLMRAERTHSAVAERAANLLDQAVLRVRRRGPG